MVGEEGDDEGVNKEDSRRDGEGGSDVFGASKATDSFLERAIEDLR